MAIKQETQTYDGVAYLYTYSDAGMLIRQTETGQIYQDALDITPCPYTYTETDQPVDVDDDIYAEAGHILLGE